MPNVADVLLAVMFSVIAAAELPERAKLIVVLFPSATLLAVADQDTTGSADIATLANNHRNSHVRMLVP
ncbi:hypothetical protein LBMAG53_01130 [Planctomycetota bacterium]|nr:hypothetical protein LBMAG53_01130 [Planctomycetota bacterium]